MKERKLEVYLSERFVGTMAQTADRRVAFAYSEEWLDNGFAISPFSLPVEQKVFVPTSQAFSGLWGVFADSLPDAWGQLLVDRMLKARGILSADMTQLERLAIVGDSGMGALAYRPDWNIQQDAAIGDLDELSAQCHAILNHEDAGDLDELFQMGGSSGGARPKIMTDEWIIKFPASDEMKDSGTMEKAYMDCAAECGIIVPETKLMPSSVCAGYFAVKRFDREKTVLKRGVNLVVISIGAFADLAFYEQVRQAAREGGAKVHLASGAIGGFDVLQTVSLMAQAQNLPETAGIETLTGARGFRNPPVWAEHLLTDTEKTTVFTGNAKEAIATFPRRVNVAVATSLATTGPDVTGVTMHSVPNWVGDDHRITAEIDGVKAIVDICSSTSAIAGWSVVALLRNLASPVVFY